MGGGFVKFSQLYGNKAHLLVEQLALRITQIEVLVVARQRRKNRMQQNAHAINSMRCKKSG